MSWIALKLAQYYYIITANFKQIVFQTLNENKKDRQKLLRFNKSRYDFNIFFYVYKILITINYQNV